MVLQDLYIPAALRSWLARPLVVRKRNSGSIDRSPSRTVSAAQLANILQFALHTADLQRIRRFVLFPSARSLECMATEARVNTTTRTRRRALGTNKLIALLHAILSARSKTWTPVARWGQDMRVCFCLYFSNGHSVAISLI